MEFIQVDVWRTFPSLDLSFVEENAATMAAYSLTPLQWKQRISLSSSHRSAFTQVLSVFVHSRLCGELEQEGEEERYISPFPL
ncbi:hypothetical protein HPP92_020254 [Vanilla planifolia]|uniref:Uncharacterized protein n=1 Tax=Vanilla planifolia TaxID=51239 RepID=A0A835UKL6_VANPL|nr:hypothetical protein HPP92_020254 [Vanilla planifolia]